jgi:hypothetical protein
VLVVPHAAGDRRPADLAQRQRVRAVVEQRRPPEAVPAYPLEVGRAAVLHGSVEQVPAGSIGPDHEHLVQARAVGTGQRRLRERRSRNREHQGGDSRREREPHPPQPRGACCRRA